MLSLIVAAAIAVLPEPPTPERIAKSVESQSASLVTILERQIEKDESTLEGVEKGRTKIKVAGKDVPKAAQVKHLKAEIKENRERLELARQRKWFKELPQVPGGISKGAIYAGREMTYVGEKDGAQLFRRDYEVSAGGSTEGGFGGGSGPRGTKRGTLAVLVRGIEADGLKADKKSKALEGRFFYVSGDHSVLIDGKTVAAFVVDVVDPAAAKPADSPKE